MTLTDIRGLTLTGATAASLPHYEAAVEELSLARLFVERAAAGLAYAARDESTPRVSSRAHRSAQ